MYIYAGYIMVRQVYKKLRRSRPLTARFFAAAGKSVRNSIGDAENPSDGEKRTPPVVARRLITIGDNPLTLRRARGKMRKDRAVA